ncbi:xylose isomerase-like protein [Ampelomyces quisqualis]|uniref:Apurinic-apyrimidinic endonuclease 1 n=1 Tax=Ampelomyces quisqualis TaxID=50730 RepID=A0A6A5QLR0_AMPQU|nr:xylose isomerase-like protein [Ampelomyces quisqualis]
MHILTRSPSPNILCFLHSRSFLNVFAHVRALLKHSSSRLCSIHADSNQSKYYAQHRISPYRCQMFAGSSASKLTESPIACVLDAAKHGRYIGNLVSHLRPAYSHFDRQRPRYTVLLLTACISRTTPIYLDRTYTTLAPSSSHTTLYGTLCTAPNMARKLPAPKPNLSLSPVPNDVVAQVKGEAAVETSANGKKRKTEATDVKVTKRTKTAAAGPAEVPRPKRRATKMAKVEEELKVEENGVGGTKVARMKRTTTRIKKQRESAPLAERTSDTNLRVGAHVSTAGGVHNSITNALHIGANAFALFMKNQRKWDNPELDPEAAKLFIAGCKEHGIDVAECCLPHGSYLVNLAHPDAVRKKQAYDSFLNDLARCNTLGIKLYNFHPGNANATTREEGIRLIAENINEAHKDPTSGEVVAVLETMASLGNTIGGTFDDLAAIIALVDNKDRVGVCLDTCHVFAAGYDLRDYKAYEITIQKFNTVIGMKYLKALHVNDSKAPLGSYRDLHARIGTGYLGLRAFHNIINDKRLYGLPMVLETPVDVIGKDGKKTEDKGIWAREIKMLEKLVGMDVESEEFRELEAKLQDEGKVERDKIGDQVERKRAKDAKLKKSKKKKFESEDESDSDGEEDE